MPNRGARWWSKGCGSDTVVSMGPLLFLISLAVATWAARVPQAARPPRVRAALLVLGVGLLVSGLLRDVEGSGVAGAASTALLVVRALSGMALWTSVVWLSTCGVPRRGRWLRIASAAIAVLLAAMHAPWAAIATFAVFATLSFGWRSALGTRALFASALGALAVVAAFFARFGGRAESPEYTGALLALADFRRFTTAVALTYVVTGFFKALATFVTDPSLGIRTVRRRLALSHLLVVGVPLVLTVGMWVLTTWLGAGSDRALLAQRAVNAEADGLRLALAQALATPGDPDAALRAVVASHAREWPHARLWRIEGGAAHRVAGDPAGGESHLATWAAGLDSLPDHGVVELEDVRWLGAAARDSARGVAAVALVPIGEALVSGPSHLADAHLVMAELRPSNAGVIANRARLAREDSLGLQRARAVARTFGVPDSAVHSRPGTGAIMISTGQDTLVGAEDSDGDVRVDSLGGAARANVAGLRFRDGEWAERSFAISAKVSFKAIVSGLYRNVSENPYNLIPIMILAGLVLLLLPVLLFNMTMVRQLGRSFVQPVAALREGTRALGEQRLEYRIPIHGDDELWDAASAFNRMAEGLERAREVQKERDRLESELDLARRIQQRLLPAAPPQVPGLEVAGHSEPAREVGGDYYDHIPLGDGRVLLVIADVSGKGVPAALLMSAFRASLMSQDVDRSQPDEVAGRLNAFLHRSVDPGKFVTAFVGFLDGRTGRFVYANAGHNPPALVRADGTVEWLATGGLILGILPESRFESGEATLAPGDLLVLYTDGVTEGADAATEQFGEDRLVQALLRRRGESCDAIANGVVREVRAFEGETGPADDITMLVARRSEG